MGTVFVGKQPVGEYRWKAPVDYVQDDGVYEAYYNGKTPCQGESISEMASLYVQGEDCLYLNIWKADEAFPQALIVANGKLLCNTVDDRITEVKGLLDYTVK